MIILDVEASGLHDESYPIQVALYDSESGDSESFYIKPAESWVYWDEEAQTIHNIPRKLLDDVGISLDESVKRICDFMAQKNETVMYCDAPDFDGFWLNRLFTEVDYGDANLSIDNVLSICDHKEEIDQIIDIMRKQNRPHDALDDCKMIWEAVREVMFP